MRIEDHLGRGVTVGGGGGERVLVARGGLADNNFPALCIDTRQ